MDSTREGTIARKVFMLEVQAQEAYAVRDFQKAISLLSELMYFEPTNPRWLEMRAQVCVDGRNYASSIMDFNEALKWTPSNDLVSRARILAGRALALEGQEAWEQALKEYQDAQSLAFQAGEPKDPYVVNSIGNCQASLQRWEEARASYLRSADIFQQSSGYRTTGGGSLPRSNGAMFAQANAALMLAQLGDLKGATTELEYVSRRGAGNVDARVALAALYYADGRVEEAEDMWNFGCNNISVGCSKYTDREWVTRVRRWPPVMVEKLTAFLTLRGGGKGGADAAAGQSA